ncbi:hypothetical protein CR513_33870, partial [Mucuna pruriens]
MLKSPKNVDSIVQHTALGFVDQVVDEEQQDYVEQQPIEHIYWSKKKTAIPSDYVVYIQELDYNIGAKNNSETFSQAMSSKESNLWYNAMKDEINYMASNQVWNLVEFPNGVKAIECKWVFKTKKTHKTTLRDIRIHSKRRNQLHIDIFSYIKERFSSITSNGYENNVRHGNIEEEVYMKQHEGFSSIDGEDLICKLSKSIYGLKQASR